ncbi:MAG: septum formation protein Maf [Opitutae bacterium]|jgi:septum formation protein|nr:septum formation protein Maf [Opitutae bacterium]MBT5910214.1 septum formation protein Maf [Opitutae bacterium]MBT7740272.1 septum formation protein Maf [Opitutae bacterium]MBT7923062.1 septum formation protein Maf [Opitutae bacterium]
MSDKKANPKEYPTFILASGSPRRRELLVDLVKAFDVITTEAEELVFHDDGPSALVMENARRKARPVAEFRTGAWVLGADTIVSIDNEIFGKPADIAEAASMLHLLSGRTHCVRTGVCLAHKDSAYEEARVETSKVTFRMLTDATIDAYFAEVDPLDKAGGYAIQTRPDLIIDRFSGSRSNVIGLPLGMLADWLREVKVL